MANSKRKCKHCKKYYPVVDGVKLPAGWFHTFDCALLFAANKQDKNRKKEFNRKEKADKKVNAQRKKNFYANDIKTRKAAAKKACHLYIRERDKDETCICCGRPLGKNFDAGHWLESGNNSFLRYHEDNIHAQSVHCNQYKGGDSGDYEQRLRAKIGNDRVDWLKANKSKLIKRSAQDYKDIEDLYNRKYRRLINKV